ncbi:MAG TPA: helix-turn-helix domain-containing protein [Phenylobacterium sp.]|jgi:AcrR family transcriptional regulator
MDSRLKQRSGEAVGVRAKALSAASEILAARGVDELNLKAIADSAGIGISSMYHYFASKEELLLSLAVAGFDDLQASIGRLRSDPATPTPLAAGARAFFGLAEAKPALFSLMFDPRLLARHGNLREAEDKTLLVFQSAVEADDRFPAGKEASVAMALWALGRGIAAIQSSQPDGRLPDDLADRLWTGVSHLINRPPD